MDFPLDTFLAKVLTWLLILEKLQQPNEVENKYVRAKASSYGHYNMWARK
jgi:hypothetical protein